MTNNKYTDLMPYCLSALLPNKSEGKKAGCQEDKLFNKSRHPEFISGSVHSEKWNLLWSKMLKHLTDAGSQGSFLACSLCKVQHDKFGFTLAEVLITLGIIGVVAAITIPPLNAKIREKQTVAKVKETYAQFQQAYRLVADENEGLIGLVNTDASDKENSTAMFKEVTKYLKKAKSCDIHTNCMGEVYRTLDGRIMTIFDGIWDDYSNLQTGILLNGTSFWILSLKSNNEYSGQIGIDINGAEKPNQLGIDFFHFSVKEGGIVKPSGDSSNTRCDIKSTTERYNGYGCTYLLLKNENMDYLRK